MLAVATCSVVCLSVCLHVVHGREPRKTDTYKVRSAKMRKCKNKQRIECEMELAKWGCENVYKMRKCEKEFDRLDHSVNNILVFQLTLARSINSKHRRPVRIEQITLALGNIKDYTKV